MAIWNADSRFALLAANTGNIQRENYSAAPAGGNSWGLQGRTFRPEDGYIDWQRYVSDGGGLYIYGKEERGRLGFVRCIQGTLWGTHAAWNVPPPLPISGRTLIVELDLYIDTASFGRSGDPWVMHAINVWVSAPSFPAGRDRNGRKPLVLDLAFFHSARSGRLMSHESDVAFHYQELVERLGEHERKSYRLDLSRYIGRAIAHFPALSGATDAQLYQLEFVIELKNAEGAVKIANFRLQY